MGEVHCATDTKLKHRVALKVLPEALTTDRERLALYNPDGQPLILEDETQAVPIRNEHIHLALPATEMPKAVDWYARVFGGQKATRNNAPVVNLPGVQMPVSKGSTGNTITYITDPWGARIEIVQRLPVGPEVRTN